MSDCMQHIAADRNSINFKYYTTDWRQEVINILNVFFTKKVFLHSHKTNEEKNMS